MPSEAHRYVAGKVRQLVEEGRFASDASELVKLFDVAFDAEGIRQVQEALASRGLASTPLSPDRPNDHVAVVIFGEGAYVQAEDIEIFEGDPGRPYRVLGSVRARVTALTILSEAPRVDDVNRKLRLEATRLGANAVIDVSYSRGISATSWKALTAHGTAVALDALDPGGAAATQLEREERIRQLNEQLASGAITEDEYGATMLQLLQQM